jgi:Fic family protein
MAIARFDQPTDMEPLIPSVIAPDLITKTSTFTQKAAELGGYFAPETRLAVAGLVRSMNGYYSNLIEGHRTRPGDIDAALIQNFSSEPKRRETQQLHYAHLETQLRMESRMRDDPGLDFLSADFIRWVHRTFYSLLPESLHQITDRDGKTYPVNPGEIRDYDVHVGIHLAPVHGSVGRFLDRFHNFYASYRHATPEATIAAMAAHHRLAWIHPFGDGNGRVTRLVTQAWLNQLGLAANGLWTLSRGLARKVDHYKEALAAADNHRLSDYDGRGYLSERRLADFCVFMIDCALDQVTFMHELLNLRELEKRLLSYCSLAEKAKNLPKGSGVLLRDVMVRGSIARGEVARILNVSARTGQTVVGDLLARGLLKSPTPKGQLTIGFPGFICPYLFPDLYPAGSPA